jgi:hypothetical protein
VSVTPKNHLIFFHTVALSRIFNDCYHSIQDQVRGENILKKQNGRLQKSEWSDFSGDGGFLFYTMSQKMKIAFL